MRTILAAMLAILLMGGTVYAGPGNNPESPSDANSGAGNDPPGKPAGQTNNPNPGK
jgi:hypothetical protein